MSEWTDWKMHPDYARDSRINLAKAIEECVKRHHLMVEELTEQQTVSAFQQAIECGDFIRLVRASSHDSETQTVIYLPYAREQQLQARVKELEERMSEIQKAIQADYDTYRKGDQRGWQGCIVSVRTIELLARKLNIELKEEM